MSDFRAISAVNAALKRVVQSAANIAVNNTTVRLGPPTAKLASDNNPLVNIHLYRIEPNSGQANAHLPVRSSTGLTVAHSKLALNLHYVFSFYGDSEKFVPDLLVAAVSLAMEQVPALSKSAIAKAIEDNDVLTDSDLANAVQNIRFTRELVSLDDFSKIWSIFYQVPHTLSLLYVASHIILESQEDQAPALPVTSRALHVTPLTGMQIDYIGGDSATGGPAYWNEPLYVIGNGLSKPGSQLVLDDLQIDLEFAHTNTNGIAVALNSALLGGSDMAVGAHTARISGPSSHADLPSHLAQKSNTIAFALHPSINLPANALTISIAGLVQSGTVKVDFLPSVQVEQSLELVLDGRDASKPTRFVLSLKTPNTAVFPASQLEFVFNEVPAGAYLVRVLVDGFPSRLEIESDASDPKFGQITGPEIVLA